MQNYMGLSNYVWWQGVVEDRQDPLELGRARVRVLGFHSEERSKVPTESLPWAYPAMPLNSTPGSIPNFKEGSWVMGFFRDGESAQEPVMTHMIDAGYTTDNNPTKGFNDPETNSGRPEKPSGADTDVGEVNTTKLARGITSGTLQDDSDIDRTYPYNSVIETESGHLIEMNDTPGDESLIVTHRNGSTITLKADQTVEVKADTVILDSNVEVTGDMDVAGDVEVGQVAKSKITGSNVTSGTYTATGAPAPSVPNGMTAPLPSGPVTVTPPINAGAGYIINTPSLP